MNLNEFLSRLEKVKKINFSEYTALCPAHDDKNPSLSVTEKDGKILLHCHRGCSAQEIVNAMGVNMSDLFTNSGATISPPLRGGCHGIAVTGGEKQFAVTNKGILIRSHVYRDINGNTLAKKSIYRKEDGSKYALWERFEKGVWRKGLGELKMPLYRIDEVTGGRRNASPTDNTNTDTVGEGSPLPQNLTDSPSSSKAKRTLTQCSTLALPPPPPLQTTPTPIP